MIGEMHGTKELSEFAMGSCNLISKNEGSAILALEIPPVEMNNFSDNMSLTQLLEYPKTLFRFLKL